MINADQKGLGPAPNNDTYQIASCPAAFWKLLIHGRFFDFYSTSHKDVLFVTELRNNNNIRQTDFEANAVLPSTLY